MSVVGSDVPFYHDPSALRSILQKGGVKVGGLSGATPRVSTCPSGGETSIFSVSLIKMIRFEETALIFFCNGEIWMGIFFNGVVCF